MTQPERPFDEPWQAQLFAMTVAMNEAGHFTWKAWAECFGPRVKNAPASHYWEIWSEALIAMLETKGISEAEEIMAVSRRWQAAARATAHGEPILLDRED